MFPERIYNVNILSERLLPSPAEVKSKLPLTPAGEDTVYNSRATLERILRREDKRLMLILGPCSIHDPAAAREYAVLLRGLAERVSDTFFLVMRTYFEKPRTTLGWKGLINDPYLDDTFAIEEGLTIARELLLYLAELGIAAGTEALDPIIPQYLHDLISWTSVGARTSESQRHREMASGLSTPIGIKNGTDGSIQVAVNALSSIQRSHHFLGISREGQCTIMETRGNPYGHLVLRGGVRPNYDAESIAECEHQLAEAGLPVRLVVDCSHGNSLKNPSIQPHVLENCVEQLLEGNRSIVGLMLESNLGYGSQKVSDGRANLKYGVSITDACLGWSTTERIVLEASETLRECLRRR
ncbi:MAG TPA: 3-deoxy-7-phosphoheptulonate synthase [Armatimonadota bacterium]|jgi:3-deoxy-7-phosphoheptulonate synthase